jgi:hypothetical protein
VVHAFGNPQGEREIGPTSKRQAADDQDDDGRQFGVVAEPEGRARGRQPLDVRYWEQRPEGTELVLRIED